MTGKDVAKFGAEVLITGLITTVARRGSVYLIEKSAEAIDGGPSCLADVLDCVDKATDLHERRKQVQAVLGH
jgi:hypothetical protein